MSPPAPAHQRLPISAVIIAADEGERLAPTLLSLGFAEDVVVVVSEAQSPTHAVATRLGARVVVQAWLGFGPQKNCALAHAKHDWVLSVDADEVVRDDLAQSLRAFFAATAVDAPNAPVGLRLRRLNHFLGKPLYHGEGGNDWLVRVFNRQAAAWTSVPVHEKIVFHAPKPVLGTLQGVLLHYSADNLTQYVHKQIRYSRLALTQPVRPVSGVHLWVNPLWRFIRFYIIKRGCLDGWAGFAHISLGAFATFLKYLYMLEAQTTAAKK